MNLLHCHRCGAPRDHEDNFCRRCGRQLTVNLPAVQRPGPVAPPGRALSRPLIGSLAVLALGTGVEWCARRLGRQLAGAAGRALAGEDRAAATPAKALPSMSEGATIDEVLYVRKVQLRR